MTRLYLRIFLSFWLVIILTIGAVWVINSHLNRAQHDDTVERERIGRLEVGLVRGARQALAANGRQGLIEWAERPLFHASRSPLTQDERPGDAASPVTRRQLRRINLHIFDSAGEEILDRTPHWRARRIAQHWRREEGKLPDEIPRGQLAHTLSHPDHGRYLIILSRPPRPFILRILGPLGPWGLITLAVLISGGICFWLARTITRPIRQLRTAGHALGQGRFETRVPEATAQRRDELGDLARGFNLMAERLEKLMASQRQLLRDVSHELRSPLARLQAALTLAADTDDEVARKRNLERTDAEVERLNRLIGEILGYARLSEGVQPRIAEFDLVDLIEDIAASARLEGAPRGLRVEAKTPASLTLPADEELLHRAIENVVRNALHYAPAQSVIEIDLEPGTEAATILVSDRGPGIPESRLEDVFEPFVRLSTERSESGSGGGVGLAIARSAIQHHDGDIWAENRPGGGLTVRIQLPLHVS